MTAPESSDQLRRLHADLCGTPGCRGLDDHARARREWLRVPCYSGVLHRAHDWTFGDDDPVKRCPGVLWSRDTLGYWRWRLRRVVRRAVSADA